MGLKGAQIPYLTLEIVKQDKCPKYNGSRILLCPTHYCVQKFTMSNKIPCPHACNMHLFNFPLLTCYSRIMLRSA